MLNISLARPGSCIKEIMKQVSFIFVMPIKLRRFKGNKF